MPTQLGVLVLRETGVREEASVELNSPSYTRDGTWVGEMSLLGDTLLAVGQVCDLTLEGKSRRIVITKLVRTSLPKPLYVFTSKTASAV